jgi:2-keto-3-deoxy-L-fuconate dehydrogenase
MSARFAGKIALLTAAGQGIGRVSALAFADEGAVVWATDINQTALDELSAQRPTIRTRLMDVREQKTIQDIVAEVGALDLLFNRAGYVYLGTILDCAENDWDLSFDISLELTASALVRLGPEFRADCQAGYSSSRTCEIGASLIAE